MNCPYCNTKLSGGPIGLVRHHCNKCFGEPSFHDWNQIEYDEFLLTDLDVDFSIQINHIPHRIYFCPNNNATYIYEKEFRFVANIKTGEIITPDNVLQIVQRILNMKVFL